LEGFFLEFAGSEWENTRDSRKVVPPPSYIYHHIEICEQDGWIEDAFILWDFILFSFLFFISKKENKMRKRIEEVTQHMHR
jgi:hypothetical protein